MKLAHNLVLALGLTLSAAFGCGGDDDGDEGEAMLAPPTAFKATTVEGKPHLTWVDSPNEEHYMIERMDHAAGQQWAVLKGAENLVQNTTQFHDATAVAGTTYMYRVVAMKGETRAVSTEVTWP